MLDQSHYDVVVIGSGIAGLSCASLFAQLYGKKVLVLERHFTAGGFTHSFCRKEQYEWDVGVHYVGEMNPRSHYRFLFDQITGGGIEWQSMPEVFDRFVYPDFTFDARCGMRNFRADLIRCFPEEGSAIERYFKDLIAAARWYGRLMISRLLPDAFHPLAALWTSVGRRLGTMTTSEYLNRYFSNPQLKAVLLSQWGNAGLPPGQSAFAVHAVIACHYFDGGFYPVGGARVIAEQIVPIIESRGGSVLTRHLVHSLLFKGKKVVGVEVLSKDKGQERLSRVYADRVISAVGAYITYEQLIPKHVPVPFRDEIRKFPPGTFHVCAYLGLKESPAGLGFRGENYWIYDGYDHDALYRERDAVKAGKINCCFAAFPSLKNPESRSHTAELITFVDRNTFEFWSDRNWGHRGEDYRRIKSRIANALIDFVDERFYGFSKLVDFCEISTPLSTANFTGHRDGCIYGLPAVPEKLSARWLSVRSPFENLYLTGSDTAGHGIVGAMMGGIMTTLVASENRIPLLRLLSSLAGRVRHPEKRDVRTELSSEGILR